MQKSRNNNGSTNKKSIKKNYQKEQQNSKDCNTAKAGKSSFNWYPGHMTKAKRMMEDRREYRQKSLDVSQRCS